MAHVSFERVTKHFGDVVALNDLDLVIADREFMVLVGPSGSGKTTALRILAGLERPTRGLVRIGDRVVNELTARERDVAMVFQDYALYPQMTVYNNLAFGLKVRRVSRREIQERVMAVAETLGLEKLLKRKPAQLSGGQRQRVALGRALVREPHVFLMDEPLSNLDAKLRAETRGEIKRLQQAIGVTTLFVTHDQVEAMTMGDRVGVMRDGHLEQVGDPQTIYSHPANTFVAGFIGSPAMNFGWFTARSTKDYVTLAAGPVRMRIATSRSVPSEVIVGIRPEHARVWRENAGLVGPLEGVVEFEEALGRESLVGVRVTDEIRIVVVSDGFARTRLGERIRIGLVEKCLYLFDKNSGQLLGTI